MTGANGSSIDTNTPVVVLRLAHPSAALGIVRSLGRLGASVYGLHESGRGAVTTSRYLEGVWRWDFATQSADATIEFLRSKAAGLGSRPLLIPTDDHGPLFIEKHRETLAES